MMMRHPSLLTALRPYVRTPTIHGTTSLPSKAQLPRCTCMLMANSLVPTPPLPQTVFLTRQIFWELVLTVQLEQHVRPEQTSGMERLMISRLQQMLYRQVQDR